MQIGAVWAQISCIGMEIVDLLDNQLAKLAAKLYVLPPNIGAGHTKHLMALLSGEGVYNLTPRSLQFLLQFPHKPEEKAGLIRQSGPPRHYFLLFRWREQLRTVLPERLAHLLIPLPRSEYFRSYDRKRQEL
jgi:hypothetical protein